ncbi:response regulator [Flavitalea sp.]|nr:response regulator [Flavitalea sp.]
MTQQDGMPVEYIVLADDDKDDCLLFKEALDELNLGTFLQVVNDGEMLMVSLNNTKILPVILFLDLNMPRKNGEECLNEIKNSAHLKHLPVVVISTSFQIAEVERLYDLGAQFYIRKPNEFDQLKSSILTAITMSGKLNGQQPSRQKFLLSPGVKYEVE